MNRGSRPGGPRKPGKKPYFPSKHEERVLYGWNACQTIFRERRDDILKVYIQKERAEEAAKIQAWAERCKVPCHLVAAGDLEHVTEASHHEGLALLVKMVKPLSQDALLERIRQGLGAPVYLFLDGVVNPHNVGAILRTAAHFGVGGLLLTGEKETRLTPAMVRIAEGGAEFVPLVSVRNIEFILMKLRNLGYQIIAADQKESKAENRISKSLPKVLVLGSERTGIRPEIKALCQYQLSIPGTGRVESLNVSVAAGILLEKLRS